MSQRQFITDKPSHDSLRFGFKYFIKEIGKSCGAHVDILNDLRKQRPGLKKMDKVEECDVILVFCPIVSRTGFDIDAALKELNTCSASKPAVFMVLHHTIEEKKIVSDSSKYIKRRNTLTVNFLFNEDDGLLYCDMNRKALIKITEHFNPQEKNLKNDVCRVISFVANLLPTQLRVGNAIDTVKAFLTNTAERHNCFIIETGKTCGTAEQILKHLHKRIPGLKKVNKVEECDVILVFCPIVSRAGSDIDTALKELNAFSESKPAVFIVLHHTIERETNVPDSSGCINRSETLTVNILFHEDDGLLNCDTNNKALTKITEHFKPQSTILWQQVKRLCSWRCIAVLLFTGAYLLYNITKGQAVVSQNNIQFLEEESCTVPLTVSSENDVFQNNTV